MAGLLREYRNLDSELVEPTVERAGVEQGRGHVSRGHVSREEREAGGGDEAEERKRREALGCSGVCAPLLNRGARPLHLRPPPGQALLTRGGRCPQGPSTYRFARTCRPRPPWSPKLSTLASALWMRLPSGPSPSPTAARCDAAAALPASPSGGRRVRPPPDRSCQSLLSGPTMGPFASRPPRVLCLRDRP